MNFQKFIDISKALKGANQTGRAFHVSFILYKKQILSIGINNYLKTHPKTKRFRYKKELVGIHSELSALIKLGEEDCRAYSLVNIRIDNNGNLAYSKPCSGCQNLIKQSGFKEVFYSDNLGFKRL